MRSIIHPIRYTVNSLTFLTFLLFLGCGLCLGFLSGSLSLLVSSFLFVKHGLTLALLLDSSDFLPMLQVRLCLVHCFLVFLLSCNLLCDGSSRLRFPLVELIKRRLHVRNHGFSNSLGHILVAASLLYDGIVCGIRVGLLIDRFTLIILRNTIQGRLCRSFLLVGFLLLRFVFGLLVCHLISINKRIHLGILLVNWNILLINRSILLRLINRRSVNIATPHRFTVGICHTLDHIVELLRRNNLHMPAVEWFLGVNLDTVLIYALNGTTDRLTILVTDNDIIKKAVSRHGWTILLLTFCRGFLLLFLLLGCNLDTSRLVRHLLDTRLWHLNDTGSYRSFSFLVHSLRNHVHGSIAIVNHTLLVRSEHNSNRTAIITSRLVCVTLIPLLYGSIYVVGSFLGMLVADILGSLILLQVRVYQFLSTVYCTRGNHLQLSRLGIHDNDAIVRLLIVDG